MQAEPYTYSTTAPDAENNNRRTRFGFNGMLRDDDVKDKLTTTTIDEGRGNSYNLTVLIGCIYC